MPDTPRRATPTDLPAIVGPAIVGRGRETGDVGAGAGQARTSDPFL